MKLVHIERLIDRGAFSSSEAWRTLDAHIRSAIASTHWPRGSRSFTLHDESGKKRRQGNGVKPIKGTCMRHLNRAGWALETPIPVAVQKKPGKMDATYPLADKLFCLEWETGNVSSSHRALNKMSLGILQGVLVGGALVVPTRSMAKYLTDRIGNFEELEPYFPFWRSLQVDAGLLMVIAIEHDGVSKSVPRIPKGTDGRADE